MLRSLHDVVRFADDTFHSGSPLKSECATTFPAMAVSVVKKSRETGTKDANVVHLLDRIYGVWPHELEQAMTEQGAGPAFIFQAVPMHPPEVRACAAGFSVRA